MASTASISIRIAGVLQAASKDDRLLKDAFRDGILLPYSGTSAAANHGIASLLGELSHLSSSRGACHQDIISYAFDQEELEVIHRNESGFAIHGGRTVPAAEATAYVDALAAVGLDGWALRQNARDLYLAYRTWGFAVQLCEVTRVGDERRLVSIPTRSD